ncbi:MAG: glycosyltransferase family 2 protein [Chloroflexia bacterium]|nr:glycosyltransferase family 2 protein [Chloroflexia bacterium]
MFNPLVSILTTVFNRDQYLSYCIESVLCSTYLEWELIIVDDLSTDHSIDIANKYALKDRRIKVFQNEKNLGDYPNRNKAASLASGKYIKYLDADDMIYPYTLEIMVNAMEQFPEAALGISEDVVEDYHPYPFQLTTQETFQRQFLRRGILGVGPTATIIRKDAFDQIGGFSGKRYIGDVECWLKLTSLFPLVKIQSGLVFWRRHEGQEFDLGHTTNSYLKMNYQMNLEALKSEDCPLTPEEKAMAVSKIQKRHSRDIFNLATKKLKPLQAYDVLRETRFSLKKFCNRFFLLNQPD